MCSPLRGVAGGVASGCDMGYMAVRGPWCAAAGGHGLWPGRGEA